MKEDPTKTFPYFAAKKFLNKSNVYIDESRLIISRSLSQQNALRVKKHYLITVMRSHGVFKTFIKQHWKRGATDDGKRVLGMYERVNIRNNEACHIEQNSKLFGNTGAVVLETLNEELQQSIEKSLKLSSSERKNRLVGANKIPKQVIVVTTAYARNPDVVAEVLLRAKGMCESCHADAPFRRSKDGSPFLEVHHIIQLSMGGKDTVENTIAVCPNCHRKFHFGA
ncbi:HNH endonuclease [Oceanimonas baumannii]|uniref:HNH endonuclease n=2 Tax=Oceanimonas baumannii TaxID=129578 RepID=A0ABY2EZZ9_9GAMM|nr:HNH endonuclease signature motif containing protein [Oceanimonas baumannii]TDW59756.1 HNH endonuclease [Oceanimonas baumannii]